MTKKNSKADINCGELLSMFVENLNLTIEFYNSRMLILQNQMDQIKSDKISKFSIMKKQNHPFHGVLSFVDPATIIWGELNHPIIWKSDFSEIPKF